jgi:hypothetical protein
MADVIPRRDGPIIYALKEVPAWCVIFLFLLVFIALWIYQPFDFIPRIVDGLVAAMLTSVITQRPKPSATNIDSVRTDTIDTDAITNSTVQATNLNLDNKEGK